MKLEYPRCGELLSTNTTVHLKVRNLNSMYLYGHMIVQRE